MKHKLTCAILLILIFFAAEKLLANTEIGVFLGNSVPTKDTINAFESAINKDISSVLWYQGWGPGYSPAFPAKSYLDDNVRYHDGYDTQTSLHITLEPFVNLNSITQGAYDNYLRSYATAAKDWGGEVRLRFGHEMIQDDNPLTAGWYSWQDNPQSYTAAYQYVYNIFKQDVGANNVKFVWSPNHHISDPSILSKYYPGQEYVDWIGIDGYNWGYATANEPWGYLASFDDIFYDIYQSIIQNPGIFGDKPIMIGEFASAQGEFKDEWIQEAFQKIKDNYKEIEALYWFNTDKERNWQVDSSAESLAAFIKAVGDAYFTSHPTNGSIQQVTVDPNNLNVNASIPAVSDLRINVAKIENSSWQQASNIDFGIVAYDSQYGIFRGNSYYAVDAGIICNQPSWSITHTTSSLTNGLDNLDNNINVIFVKQNEAGATELAKYTFNNSNGISYGNTDIDSGSWLRIYYGIATGSGDAPGAEPITITKRAGTYAGSITLTLTVL